MYIRCQPGLEKWLPSELEQRYDRKFPPDLDRALNEVASAEGSRTYLILDQFERVARPYDAKPAGVDELKAFLEKLISKTPETITIIYVARTDSATGLLTVLMRLKFPYDQMFEESVHLERRLSDAPEPRRPIALKPAAPIPAPAATPLLLTLAT